MREILPGDRRGRVDEGWLESAHTFSFGRFYDATRMGFGPLRVLNEDRVAPGRGFGRHGHHDMEILSVVLEGALEHRDDLGNGSVLHAGSFQRMTAGTGVRHSEWNASASEPLRFLQIWIEPAESGLPPGYQEHRPLGPADGLEIVASGRSADAPLAIHQDASIYRIGLETDKVLVLDPGEGRRGYLHVIRGALALEGQTALGEGDALAFADERPSLRATTPVEALYFDLP